MLCWTFSFGTFFLAIHSFWPDLLAAASIFGVGRDQAALSKVISLLHELQETLEAGLVPAPERWDALKDLCTPWNQLAYDSLQELRQCGGALLPTLRRLRSLAEDHRGVLKSARAKASQALMQALACGVLVPAFGGTLYFLLPGVSSYPWVWLGANTASLITATAAMAWLLRMADQARWAGLATAQRPWMLAVYCAGERFLALVRSGSPPDIAWTRACLLLLTEAPELAARWGSSVWTESPSSGSHVLNSAAGALVGAGGSIRKAVQVSLMEGRPCTERVEAALQALKQNLQAEMDRELSLLSTRALKPLFIFVAPALLLLLAFGFYLSWEQNAGGIYG